MGILDIKEAVQVGVNSIKVGKKIINSVRENDEQSEVLAYKGKRSKAMVDEIRCDEQSYLVWKWHPIGSKARENNRENAIRFGSSLRVKEGSVAVFVYNLAGEQMQDCIEGPFDKIIATENLPGISKLFETIYGGGTPFQAEIYFINLSERVQTKFAVPFFDLIDERFPNIGVPVAVRGTFMFRISDYREFIRLHGLDDFSMLEFQKKVNSVIARYVKRAILEMSTRHGISIEQIENKTEEVIQIAEPQLAICLKEDFGVTLIRLDINVIEIDKTSKAYCELSGVTKDYIQSSGNVYEEICKYKDMLDNGILSEREFEEVKKKLIEHI